MLPIESLNSIFALALTPLRYAGTDLLKCSNPPGMATTKRTNQMTQWRINYFVWFSTWQTHWRTAAYMKRSSCTCSHCALIGIVTEKCIWHCVRSERYIYACFGFESELAVFVANSFRFFFIRKMKTQNAKNDTWPPMQLENTARVCEWMRAVFHFYSPLFIRSNQLINFRTACTTRIWWPPINFINI